MNDVCRARASSSSNSNVASLVKICRSGQNRTRVPVLPLATRLPLRVSPDFARERRRSGRRRRRRPGTPRRNDMPCWDGDRSTSTSIRAESALTTEAPTPCRPPVATYEPPPNLPPACSLVKTTSTPGSPVLGSLSTGMPRPSSWTSTEPSGCRVTSIRCAAPASASSTPLSMISHRQCISPRVSVEPMYMPGALADRLEPLEDQQVCGVVGVVDRGASCEMSGARAPNLPATRRGPMQARAVASGHDEDNDRVELG